MSTPPNAVGPATFPPAECAASGRFGQMVTPAARLLDAFTAMAEESVATGETDLLVTEARLRRRPGLFLRQLEAERQSGVARYWLVSDGDVLATAMMRAEGTRWFGNLGYFVRPSRRNQGIGRAVLADLVAMAHRSGVAVPRAVVDPGNTASRRAIAAAGGTLVEILSDYGISRCVYEFA